MNSLIESLNQWGGRAIDFAGPMLWQSSLLIAALFVIELAVGRKLRPAVRYALWLLVPIKLLLPPALAFPSGLGWWLRPPTPAIEAQPSAAWVVRYGPVEPLADTSAPAAGSLPVPHPVVSKSAWVCVGWAGGSAVLLAWMLSCWRKLHRISTGGQPASPWLMALLEKSLQRVGLRKTVRLVVVDEPMSPAVFGLVRQTILMPRLMVEGLSCAELRGTILHELVHMRRRDVWVNFGQTLVQTVYWWHPLVWLASARARGAREEAVDAAAMALLEDDRESYPATLLRVGRLVMSRSLTTLGLIGILESRSALRRRIERLTDVRHPPRAGLSLSSGLCILAFGALALPMGQAPPKLDPKPVTTGPANPWPDPRFQGYARVKFDALFWQVDETSLGSVLPLSAGAPLPITLTSNQVARVLQHFDNAGVRPVRGAQPLGFAKFSGGLFRWRVGGCTNNLVNYVTQEMNGRTIVTGAETTSVATEPSWIPLELTVVPWSNENSTRCEMKLGTAANRNATQEGSVTIRPGDAALWATLVEPSTRKYEVVLLTDGGAWEENSGASADSVDSAAIIAAARAQPSPRPADGSAAPHASSRSIEEHLSSKARRTDPEAVSRLVQQGKLYYDLGKLDQAEAKFRQALAQYPIDQKAHYYLSLIENVRARRASGHRPRTVEEALDQGRPRLKPALREPLPPDEPQLYTRIMKIDTNAFRTVMSQFMPGGDVSRLGAKEMREFFAALGVDLTPPKICFYSDTRGDLMVRATLRELETFESSLTRLMSSRDQVWIKASFVRLPARDAKAFWEQRQSRGETTNGIRSAYLGNGEAQAQLSRWKAALDPSWIQTVTVTTLNGREVEMADLVDVPTYTGAGFVSSISIGPRLDLRPIVAWNGASVRMTIAASLTELVGYDESPVGVLNRALDGFAPVEAPHLRIRRLTNEPALSVDLTSGQTVALGEFAAQEVEFAPDYSTLSASTLDRPAPPPPDDLILLLTSKMLPNPAK